MTTNQATTKCPHCGAELDADPIARWHKINRPMVEALIQAAKSERPQFHPQRDLDLTHNQYNNWQKLQYFGLIRKAYRQVPDQAVEDKDFREQVPKRLGGYWEITEKGYEFLAGQVVVNVRVATCQGKVVGVSPEWVHIRRLVDTEYWKPQDYAINCFAIPKARQSALSI